MGEDRREVTFRGERKGLVKDLRGEAIDDSWEIGHVPLICRTDPH